MEKNNPISDLLQESMTKLRELADTNSIVGQPIHTPDGVTLIPISRVSLGVGVSIDPIAFLIVKDGFTRVMPVAAPPLNTVDRIVEMAPDVIDKVTGFIEKQQEKKAAEAVAEEC